MGMSKAVLSEPRDHSMLRSAVRVCLAQCRHVSGLASAGSLILGSLGAHAQSTPATGPAQDATEHHGLEEIIVTAQRRSQSVQDIPYNITAVDGLQIQKSGATTLNDLNLLGHKSGRITTHYSQAELSNLIDAAEKVCEAESRKTPATTWLRRKAG
jgi:hypothetical protein